MLGRAFCSYCLQINLALSRIALFYPQYFNKLGEITIRCHLRLIRLCFQLLSNILYQLTALRPLSVCETLRLQHGLPLQLFLLRVCGTSDGNKMSEISERTAWIDTSLDNDRSSDVSSDTQNLILTRIMRTSLLGFHRNVGRGGRVFG